MSDWALVLAGALLGGFVSGLAGFGTGLVALGIWLHALPPAVAATLVILCSVVSQLQTIRTVWHAIAWRQLGPMVLAGLLGVPLGTGLLAVLDPAACRLGMGVLLVAFAAGMLALRRPLHWRRGGRAADAAVGFAGGVLGGLAGLSGVLPTVWAALRGWGKEQRRGVFQGFNLAVLLLALASHAAGGMLTGEALRAAAVALPGTLLGAWCGVRAYRRLSDRRFHDLVLWLLGLSGAALLVAQ